MGVFKLKKTDGQWDMVREDGQFATVNGSDEVLQKCAVLFGTARGEYFYNSSYGFPWLNVIRNPKQNDITNEQLSSQVTTAALSIDGVLSIPSPIKYTSDEDNQILKLTISIQTADSVSTVEVS